MQDASRPARTLFVLILLAAVALEALAFVTYRDSADGQAVLVNAAIAVYAAIAVGIVFAVDLCVRWVHSQRPAKGARRRHDQA